MSFPSSVAKTIVAVAWLAVSLTVAIGAPANNLKRLPPPVRQTVQEEFGATVKVGKISRVMQDGQKIFKVEITTDGKERELTLAPDGTLLEKEVFQEELPTEVQKALHRLSAGSVLGDITETFYDHQTNFDAETGKGSSTREFSVNSQGEVVSQQMGLGDVPAAIQNTIREKLNGAKLQKITCNIEKNEKTYEVEMLHDGRLQKFSVDADGEYLGLNVEMKELPEAVQQTIQAESGTGTIMEITKSDEEGETYYDAEISGPLGLRDLVVTSDGHLESTERPMTVESLPVKVKAIVTQQTSPVIGLSEITEDGSKTYVIKIRKNGVKQELTVDANGGAVEQ